jgi:Ca-activated chloride channel family protein
VRIPAFVEHKTEQHVAPTLNDYVRFVWPEVLWLLLAIPALVGVYIWALRRKAKASLRWPGIAPVRQAQGSSVQWRRHTPPALFLVSLVVMIVAMARPTTRILLPVSDQTIILAMDVSASMGATDVTPDRLTAAQEAAKLFVNQLPRDIRVGVVSFAGTAALVQPPTLNRENVFNAIDRFQLQAGTAIGSGIVVSLATLFPDEHIVLAELSDKPQAVTGMSPRRARMLEPNEPGSYRSAAVVLLTDGQRTAGPDLTDAARMAADHGVRVYTVGIGTKAGKVIQFQGWSVRVKLDEDSLKKIADLTRGEYFNAGSADDLRDVYGTLQSRVVLRHQETEITALVVALGTTVAVTAAFLSLAWHHRLL